MLNLAKKVPWRKELGGGAVKYSGACLPEEFPPAQPWYPSINHSWWLHYILIPKAHLLSSEKIKGEACLGTREHVNRNPTPLFVNPLQGSNCRELIKLVLTQWRWCYLCFCPLFFLSLFFNPLKEIYIIVSLANNISRIWNDLVTLRLQSNLHAFFLTRELH